MSFPWRTALFVSLALNLALVSAALGAFATGARLARPADVEPPQRVAGQRAFMQALPAQQRAAVRRELARTMREMEQERAQARSARLALYEALTAEPYDRERTRAAFSAVRAADAVLVAAYHEALTEGFGRVNAEDRASALEAFQNQRRDPPTEGAPQTRQERSERRRQLRQQRPQTPEP